MTATYATAQTAELPLAEQLERGPGSRELSDKVLMAMGWLIETCEIQPGPQGQEKMWRAPGSKRWTFDGADPARSVDDALAMAPEGVQPAMIVWEEDEDGEYVRAVLNNGHENFTGKAYGEDPLPRAISLAALAGEGGDLMKNERYAADWTDWRGFCGAPTGRVYGPLERWFRRVILREHIGLL